MVVNITAQLDVVAREFTDLEEGGNCSEPILEDRRDALLTSVSSIPRISPSGEVRSFSPGIMSMPFAMSAVITNV